MRVSSLEERLRRLTGRLDKTEQDTNGEELVVGLDPGGAE